MFRINLLLPAICLGTHVFLLFFRSQLRQGIRILELRLQPFKNCETITTPSTSTSGKNKNRHLFISNKTATLNSNSISFSQLGIINKFSISCKKGHK